MTDAIDRFNLADMSPDDLKELRGRIDKQEQQARRNAKEKAVSEILEVAAKHGYKMADLFPNGVQKAVRKPLAVLQPKFRNPDDAEMVWNGRGRQPDWFKEKLAAGVERADMLIRD